MLALTIDPPDLGTARRLATALDTVSPITIQAAIMLAHVADRPDWTRIAELYDALLRTEPNATFAVGRAVACSHAFGPEVGLADLDDLAGRPDLSSYRYLHAARADCLARLGRHAEASQAYGVAAALASNATQRAYFEVRAAR